MNAQADKFRTLAEAMEKPIKAKLADRLANTPKRQLQARSDYIEVQHMARVQAALFKMSEAAAAGTLPVQFAKLTKATLMTYFGTKTDHPSYYSIIDTGVYRDESEPARAFRAWFVADMTFEQSQAQLEEKKRASIRDIEQKLIFANIPGYFPTPPELADRMVELLDLEPHHHVLEPSAGSGALVDAIERRHGKFECQLIECNYTLAELLEKKFPHCKILRADFMKCDYPPPTPPRLFDRIIMNPPFENLQDIDHVQHAFTMLKPGGKLVTIMSPGPFYRSDRKAAHFVAWLTTQVRTVDDLPAGTFKASGTGVSAKLVTIEKE